MFNFGRSARLKAGMKEIQELILTQSVQVSGDLSQGIDDEVNVEDEMVFKRLFTQVRQTFYPYSLIDQLYAAMEGLACFVHCFNRFCYRPGNGILREKVFDPSVIELVNLFAKMIRSQSQEYEVQDLQDSIFALISERECQYGDMPSLLGSDTEDKLSVYHAAGRIIAQEVGSVAVPALEKKMGRLAIDYLELRIRVELLRGFKEMGLGPKVKSIEKYV